MCIRDSPIPDNCHPSILKITTITPRLDVKDRSQFTLPAELVESNAAVHTDTRASPQKPHLSNRARLDLHGVYHATFPGLYLEFSVREV